MEYEVSNSYTITLLTKPANPGLGNEQSPHYLNMARNPEVLLEGPADTRWFSTASPAPNNSGLEHFYVWTDLFFRGSTQAWHCTTWAVWGKARTTRRRWTWQGCAISPIRSSSCQAPLETRWRRDSFVPFNGLWLSGLADSSWMGKTRAVPSFTLHLQCSDSWGEEGPVEKIGWTWCWKVPE